MPKFIQWFDQIDNSDLSSFGKEAVNLANLKRAGFQVPEGFAISPNALVVFLDSNNLRTKIKNVFLSLSKPDKNLRHDLVELVRETVDKCPLPLSILEELHANYKKLTEGKSIDVKLKLSPSQSNVFPKDSSIIATRKTLASSLRYLWNTYIENAILDKGLIESLNIIEKGVAVTLCKWLQPESSGKIFTRDFTHDTKNRLLVISKWGLNSNAINTNITDFDNFEVDKSNLKIIFKHIFSQKTQFIRIGSQFKRIPVAKWFMNIQKISDKNILEMAKIGKKLENHFGSPQEVDWIIHRGKIVLLSSTNFYSPTHQQTEPTPNLNSRLQLLTSGRPIFPGIATGIPKIIRNFKHTAKLKKGDVLVTDNINRKILKVAKKASAIITMGKDYNYLGILEKISVPYIAGVESAIQTFSGLNYAVTVNGTTGQIFKGSYSTQKPLIFPSITKKTNPNIIASPSKTATKVYVSLGQAEIAREVAKKKDVNGVGMVKSEIIFSSINTHPKKFIAEKKSQVFINNLVKRLSPFISQFDPKPVIYKSSDLESSEYKILKGGGKYESSEANLVFGPKGGSRYVIKPEEFEMELEAIKTIRNKLGYKNLWLMIPFVSTLDQLEKIKKTVTSSGLHRSDTFKIILMVNIPSNVVLIEKFLDIGIDGAVVNLDDISNFTLGVSKKVLAAPTEINGLDPAVSFSVEKVVRECSKRGLYSSIVGQDLTSQPELIDKLVSWGISSVTVPPSVIDTARKLISDAEKNLISSK